MNQDILTNSHHTSKPTDNVTITFMDNVIITFMMTTNNTTCPVC